MKKILAVILLSLSVIYTTGCKDIHISDNSSQTSNQTVQSSSDTQKSQDEKSADESKNESSADKSESSADENEVESSADEISGENSEEESSEPDVMAEAELFDFMVKINDVVYTLPFEYSELEENGYYLGREGELSPETYSKSMEWKNEEGSVIKTQLWNPSNKPKDYSECKIGSVEIQAGENLEVIMPGGFAFDTETTPEKVKEQYGEPESEHVYNDYVTLRYKVELSQTIEFFIYTNENYTKFSSVTVKNFS